MGLSVVRYVNPEGNCLDDLYWAAHNINHTGQECCGFALFDGERISHQAYDGQVRGLSVRNDLGGYGGIANVNVIRDHQPRIFDHRTHGKYALSFDGFVVNEAQLRADSNETYSTPYQVELIANLIGQGSDIPEGLKNVARKVVGAYTIALLNDRGEIYVARDPLAMKPIVSGKSKRGFAVATESRALDKIEMTDLRDLEPGEICIVDQFGVHNLGYVEGPSGRERKHCSFLWGYFSSPDSIIEGIPVNLVRERAGANLAQMDIDKDLEFDVVCPVPDSGKPYAEGYARHAVIAGKRVYYSEGLLKYEHALKSYTRPTQTERDREADMKINVVRNRVEGKRVILCEDSIRRGTQLARVPIRLLKEARAAEIHLRVGTPRNTMYCRFDKIEKPDSTLVANEFATDEEVANFLGVNSVRYISTEEFVTALTEDTKLTRDDFCLGCYIGEGFDFLGKKVLDLIE